MAHLGNLKKMQSDTKRNTFKYNTKLYIFVHRILVILFGASFEDRIFALRDSMAFSDTTFSRKSLDQAVLTFIEEDGSTFDFVNQLTPPWWSFLLEKCKINYRIYEPYSTEHGQPDNVVLRSFCKRFLSLDTYLGLGEWRSELAIGNGDVLFPTWAGYTMEEVLEMSLEDFKIWWQSAVVGIKIYVNLPGMVTEGLDAALPPPPSPLRDPVSELIEDIEQMEMDEERDPMLELIEEINMMGI